MKIVYIIYIIGLYNRHYRIKISIQVPVFWCILVYFGVFLGNCGVLIIVIQVF